MTLRNHIDHWTLFAVMFLMFMSLGIVYSASASWAWVKYGESERMLISHGIKVLLGIGAMFVGLRFDYHRLQKLTKPALVAAVLLLGVTLVLGGESKGATRWLRYGSLGFQPSEFAKYALLFHLCTLATLKGALVRNFRQGFIPMMIWVGLVTGLVFVQPNFSMAAMIFLLSMILLFLGGTKPSHLASTLAILIPVFLLVMLTADYRRARLLAFFGGGSGASGGYQLTQGILGFGNGGIFGVGPGDSRQRDLFLPESYGDFVFSIVGEEWGFIGTIAVMGLFLLIMLRGFRIARRAEDDFGRMLAYSVTSAIVVYALVNAAVTLGILPTTGLPMPFVSYGGSSMVFSAFAAGILLNISSQTDMHPRARQVPVVGTVSADRAVAGKVY